MRRRPPSAAQLHQDWLAQVETDGPFLSLPVLKDMWPNGMEPLSDVDDRLVKFKESHAAWEQAFDRSRNGSSEQYAAVARSWVDVVLDLLAEWEGHGVAPVELPEDLVVRSPGETIAVRPDGALRGRDGELACLLRVVPPTDSLHAAGVDGWSASEVDRMAALLRRAGVAVGVVTDGRWWALVWAGDGTTTGWGVVDALSWREEPRLRDAFLTLVSASTLRHANPERRLPRLFERSVLETEEITEALGVQVRKSVELLVQAFSEARLSARGKGLDDPLCEDPDEIYQAAVTVMMRVVFLLFAEERGMLPTPELYRAAYGISDLLDGLQTRAQREGEENLDHSTDVWHRLLAVSAALYGGANFDEVRMPAYGGSLFDPQRFPWLTAERPDGELRLRVSDRVMLHVLESVQVAKVGGQARRISFRDVDVEQIGYIYEGLLGYTCREVDAEVVLGLVGKDGEEPEIDLDTLAEIYEESRGAKDFAAKLSDWVKQTQPAAKLVSVAKLAKLHDTDIDEAEMNRLLKPIAGDDPELLPALVSWGNLIRRDLRDLPYVVPRGGLVVSETPSRKNAGAHYTPRSLAEEVVLHALQPLVYEPGPLQTNDENAWRLKSSSAILDLKVADIAAGSGAFLVAAARYLADRLVEAWTAEAIVDGDRVDLGLRTRAIRDVIAHCLYGADINGMAVEMCKLSLWLVSLDPTKPFSFVDDKVFHGNSLLGLTTLDQLRYLHIAPDTKKSKGQLNAFVDAEAVLHEVIRIRHQLATTVDEDDPHRTRNGKRRLLDQSEQVTEKLRLIADGIVATALRLGGKAGTALDDALTALEGALIRAFPADDTSGDTTALNWIIEEGLTPTVPTDYERWEPLHWILEAPDVLFEHDGFDAIVGNPPFLHSKKITSSYGQNLRNYLSAQVANGEKGDANLVAYFLLRAFSLLRHSGTLGFVATNAIDQAMTRKVGLARLVPRRARMLGMSPTFDWGSRSASVSVLTLWLWKNKDDDYTSTIEEPFALKSLGVLSFIGTYPNGNGFRIATPVAKQWLSEDGIPSRLLPFVRAEDLSTGSAQEPSEYIIDLHGLSQEQAQRYQPLWEHLREHQLPWRARPSVKARLRERWWDFESAADSLYQRLAGLDKAIAFPRTSNLLMPLYVPAGGRFDMGVVVYPTASLSIYGQLASSLHYHWVLRFGGTLRDDPSYAPRRITATFPWRSGLEDSVGVTDFRDLLAATVERRGGLRPVMNEFNSATTVSDEIDELRQAYVELDRSIMSTFGWTDMSPSYSVVDHNNLTRFSVDSLTRQELLRRLLEENHRIALAEGQSVAQQGRQS
ncbi:SAM-dependent DNA methyltransferase [Blastococcus sp. TF02A-30]|uniref:Eco57I restriction-modification methylase domain-containing protein n=1 Tax=Blastococcus sp. TF02A-30 TaxID=2250580 RepID=UPI000DE862A6|nr:SAM-dependent DNA methyltransferase [Blastococcus sp. TF02A-30]RBY91049.1 SAM-dependent DNA methyltransferase [Blastococcus sp. TF02A-30]